VLKHFLNPPNWFTSASIFCSVFAMAQVMSAGVDPAPEVLVRACILVVFGGIFDLLDGRVARLTKRFTEFGVQLDSIADIISFGVAPAMLVWAWKLHELGTFGAIVTFVWVLFAAFRLARFNVEVKAHEWPYKGYAQGLTSTMAGGSLVTFVWVTNGYLRGQVDVPAGLVAALVLAVATLMVSSVPLPDFRDLRRNKFARHITAIFLGVSLTGFLFDPSIFFAIGAALYLTYGVAEGTFAVLKRRLAPPALTSAGGEVLADDDEDVEDPSSD
jgi:CDP-diacylglycerol--serine O-phosphatidyltransferase